MKYLNKLVIGTISLAAFATIAIAAVLQIQTPLCSDNQTAFISLDNTTGSYGFFTCYTKPEAFELKIIKVSLIKKDGSGNVDIYTPSSPTYQDLISGQVNLLEDLNLRSGNYNGVYSGIEIIFDNDIKIKAKAQYSGSDVPTWGSLQNNGVGYCHTLAYNATTTPSFVNSFAGTASGNPSRFGDHPTFVDSEGASFANPGLTTFRYLGSPMEGAGITGVDRVFANSAGSTVGAYWAKVRYLVTGDASVATFSVLDSSYNETRYPNIYDPQSNSDVRNARFAKYQFDFANDLVIDSTTNQVIDIKFNLDKSIGFSWNYSSSGSSSYAHTAQNNSVSDGGTYYYEKSRQAADYESWNGSSYANQYPDCLRMFIGQVGLTLTATSL